MEIKQQKATKEHKQVRSNEHWKEQQKKKKEKDWK